MKSKWNITGVEISFQLHEDGNYEHIGYFDNVGEAINGLSRFYVSNESAHKLDGYEQACFQKIRHNEPLTLQEVKTLVHEYADNIEKDEHRWHRDMEAILHFEDKYYCLFWKKGLTELQSNEYDLHPIEVQPRTKVTLDTVYYAVGAEE